MDAADIGDDHVLAERGLVDEAVDAGAERLHPFELLGGCNTSSFIIGPKVISTSAAGMNGGALE